MIHPSSHARSTMEYSMFLMVTGLSTRPATHAPSHGAGHTRPVNSGKLLVWCSLHNSTRDGARERGEKMAHHKGGACGGGC